MNSLYQSSLGDWNVASGRLMFIKQFEGLQEILLRMSGKVAQDVCLGRLVESVIKDSAIKHIQRESAWFLQM